MDGMSTFFSKVPILNKFEVDKIFKFIQLVFTKPAIASSLGVIIWAGVEYNKDQNATMLFLFVSALLLFITITLIDAKLTLDIVRFKEVYTDRQDAFDLLVKVTCSQEGIRASWMNGWKDILLFMLSIEKEHMESLLKMAPSNERDILLNNILSQFDVTYNKYIDLMPYIDSSMDEFQIGMQKPPPKSKQKSIDELKGLLDKLKKIDDI